MISQGHKKVYILFCIFSLAGFITAILAYSEKSLPLLYFLWRQPFLVFIRIFCIALFCFLFFKLLNRKVLSWGWLKWLGGIIFLPVLILPAMRCCFKVPYVFCRVCPDKCPWGLSRTLFFTSFVSLNLSGRFWCTAVCPVGTFQECQAQLSKKHLKPYSWLSGLPYIILFLAIGMYFLTFFASPWVESFEHGEYVWVAVTISIAILIIAAAFFITRFWCRYFCPIGTITELSLRLKRLLKIDKKTI